MAWLLLENSFYRSRGFLRKNPLSVVLLFTIDSFYLTLQTGVYTNLYNLSIVSDIIYLNTLIFLLFKLKNI